MDFVQVPLPIIIQHLGTLFYRKIVASQEESNKRSEFVQQLWEQTKDAALYPLLAEVSAESQQAEELLKYLHHVHCMKNLIYFSSLCSIRKIMWE